MKAYNVLTKKNHINGGEAIAHGIVVDYGQASVKEVINVAKIRLEFLQMTLKANDNNANAIKALENALYWL